MATGAGAVRAGRAFVELFTNDSALKKGLEAAAQRVKNFGAGIAAAGGKIKAVGDVISAPFIGAAKGFADAAGDLDRLSKITGVSASSLSELSLAAGGLDNLQLAFRGLGKTMLAAQDGSDTASWAIERLGRAVGELSEMTPEQRLLTVADSLSQVEDAGEQAGIAMGIFGKSGMDLMPFLSRGAAGIEQFRQIARDSGQALTDDQVRAGNDLKKAYKALDGTISGIWTQIGAAVAPVMTELLGMAKNVVMWVGNWVKENKELLVTLFKWSVGISLVGGALVSLGGAITTASVAFSGLAGVLGLFGTVFTATFGLVGTAVGAVLTPMGLVAAAVAGLGAYLLQSSGTGGQALDWLGARWQTLKETAVSAWDGIKDALAKGDLGLAAAIAWAGVKVAFYDATEGIRVAWVGVSGWLQRQWITTTANVKAYWSEMTAFLKEEAAKLLLPLAGPAATIGELWSTAALGAKLAWMAFVQEITKGFVEVLKLLSVVAPKVAVALAGALNSGGTVENFGKHLAAARERAAAEKDKRLADLEDEQARSLAKAQGAKAAAQAELDALRNRAKERLPRLPVPENFGPGIDTPVRRPPTALDTGREAAGTFSAQVAAQLGVGKSYGEKQLKELKQANKKLNRLDDLVDAVRDAAPQFAY